MHQFTSKGFVPRENFLNIKPTFRNRLANSIPTKENLFSIILRVILEKTSTHLNNLIEDRAGKNKRSTPKVKNAKDNQIEKTKPTSIRKEVRRPVLDFRSNMVQKRRACINSKPGSSQRDTKITKREFLCTKKVKSKIVSITSP